MSAERLVLGIDGGNSKVDVALAGLDGRLVAARRGPTVSHQAVGLETGMARLAALAAEAMGAGRGPVELAVASLAGADYPEDIRLLERAIGALGIANDVVVVNDTVGALRAGVSRAWGVGLVCGQGINASAIAPDGRSAGFPAVGDIAGDWGGAGGVGMAGLRAAVRGRDGRGPRTSLETAVPRHFGLARPAAVTKALYDGRIAETRIPEICPVVFHEAGRGDEVSRAIVDRLANELAGMANALIRKLHLARTDVEVVLAGGVFRTEDRPFYATLERAITAVAPRARLVHLEWPPVCGAVLLAIDDVAPGSSEAVAPRLRGVLAEWDRAQLSGN